MSFSTTSYLAGVGSVVAALTVGFSGGLFMAAPTHYEQNRLQRVMGPAPDTRPPQSAAATAPAIDAPKPDTTEANASPQPVPAIQPPARPEPIPVMAKAVEPDPAPVMAKAPEPVRVLPEQERSAQRNAEKIRAAEARAAERKRAEAKKFAQRRKQKEIELAADAVRQMPMERDSEQFDDRAGTPQFGFFGQD
jgi:hypothetical protein